MQIQTAGSPEIHHQTKEYSKVNTGEESVRQTNVCQGVGDYVLPYSIEINLRITLNALRSFRNLICNQNNVDFSRSAPIVICLNDCRWNACF